MTKFAPAAEFQRPLDDTYQLAYFRFSPLDDERYVLTNQAGEYLVLPRAVLAAFVNHELPSTHPSYSRLRSRQFLFDASSSIGKELLALKVRTKAKRLENFTSLHIMVVSLRCEHSCPYCQVSRQSEDRSAFDMSEETAEKALALIFQSPSPAIKIEFQGGEPLLNFSLIQHVVHRAEAINKVAGRSLQFVITTNLAVVTDEILEFCREHSVLISTSLDGPASLHNTNRPRPGKNSYELAVAGIHKARLALGHERVSALMTTTKASLPLVRQIIDEYVRLDFPGIFLRPLSPYGFAVKTKSYAAYDVDRWLDFYFDGLNYILELNRNGIPFKEFYAATILTKMLTPFEPGYVDLMSPAGIGISAVVYNYDASVYASDEARMLAEMGDKTFLLGNVHENTYGEIFGSDALLDPIEQSFAGSAPMCADCAYEPFCGSDPVFHTATQGDFVGLKTRSGFCNRNMSIFKRLIDLMERDVTARELFLSWAN
ncbi:His-Xaa-Ser system radical SAM maturase HxsB [Mesorhizobium sp. M7A.F.Ca.MR.148.00.0.0]|uniref:His-Xaa-Ser system radical SAM maturase HxsB n=1 Tax=Mesorhizobium sp. M7A.F.Ca.MR.148.00.0.0 TaxID=2496775 RepID=UPI000FCA0187|nr:His-Xaa-Ser system radical SAM maturase HxsB [Mesorhizobium sp. M7A.F.Ca.MR.148.00.0.0]RUV37514.1 His-Xaa-Ser system radical SAM maturase HxsB [Mesorhizobium sp. M7A.F.Ca.MR.148.00.0.0]